MGKIVTALGGKHDRHAAAVIRHPEIKSNARPVPVGPSIVGGLPSISREGDVACANGVRLRGTHKPAAQQCRNDIAASATDREALYDLE